MPSTSVYLRLQRLTALSVFVAVSLIAQLVAAFIVDKNRRHQGTFFQLISGDDKPAVASFCGKYRLVFLFAVMIGITGL